MTRGQSVPETWLVADERLGVALWPALEALPRGSGVLVINFGMPKARRARLLARIRRVARRRGLTVADELAGEAARVHNMRELRDALLRGAPVVLISPLYWTRSHPCRPAMPRMRAAALARHAKVPAIALGGMDFARFRRVSALGFAGWAAIDALRGRA